MSEPEPDRPGAGTLSVHRSFVVRLYATVDADAGEISGRVEHIVSGNAKEFRSVEELLSSFSMLLGRERVATR
jgi:hypothetical protein